MEESFLLSGLCHQVLACVSTGILTGKQNNKEPSFNVSTSARERGNSKGTQRDPGNLNWETFTLDCLPFFLFFLPCFPACSCFHHPSIGVDSILTFQWQDKTRVLWFQEKRYLDRSRNVRQACLFLWIRYRFREWNEWHNLLVLNRLMRSGSSYTLWEGTLEAR